jgi:hypothetical protein
LRVRFEFHPGNRGKEVRRMEGKREITLSEFADELVRRLQEGKTIDCCKDELLRLAVIVKKKIGQEKILVSWKD